MAKKLRVLFLLPVVGQPRHAKRIEMLPATEFIIKVAAFSRDYHSGRVPTGDVQILGHIYQGRYLRRLWRFLRAFPILRRLIREHDLVYAFGPDMAMLAIVAGWARRRPIVYEIGDIRAAQVANNFSGKLTRWLDRRIAKSVKLLVATSADFIEGYYRQRLGYDCPAVIIENKLEAGQEKLMKPECLKKETTFPLTIGYFGLLRCRWSAEVLVQLAKALCQKVRIVVAGFEFCEINFENLSNRHENIEFLGSYRSPDDLPRLYQQVDLVWAAYPPPNESNPDWRWAQAICRSNRFYEACFFQRPLICVADSADGAEVKRLGIGLLLEDQEIMAVVNKLAAIDKAQFDTWCENLKKVPSEVYQYSAELQLLSKALRRAILT